ncbi:hypothetical protein HO173_009273 [Letharia columbiana]|uniref:General stress protein FMN-binding split barrel domain-containing protein n=1 Tax=Letharia columbiana TaxID=112416 RepID=A0A8H6FQ14_9LECA|nr:uncharacterized protein HO173_009273 [Letharia columbiana]KAF6232605.1 hypothetical protein HO173_009273 [Letharia columbiana]
MPDPLKESHVDSKTDPTVANQWDDKTPKKQQIEDFYKTVDGMKIGLLTTIRDGIGPVARAMAVAKREGPDFLFLANTHSNKFSDLAGDPTAQLTFQNSSSQDWVSVTGTVVTTANDDPRIKELYSKGTAAWFGDLGDGVHNGTAEDPRMAIIELRAKYISYWKATVGTLGFVKEVAQASLTGQVANTGMQRRLPEEDIEAMRKVPSS